MSEKSRIETKIKGRYYTIISDEPEEYVYKICVQVDKKVTEISSANPILGMERASILAAINFADELHKSTASEESLRKQILENNKKINELQSKVYELERKLTMTGKINK